VTDWVIFFDKQYLGNYKRSEFETSPVGNSVVGG